MNQQSLNEFLNNLERHGIKVIPSHNSDPLITGGLYINVAGWSVWPVWVAKAQVRIQNNDGHWQLELSIHPETQCLECLDQALSFVSKLSVPNASFVCNQAEILVYA